MSLNRQCAPNYLMCDICPRIFVMVAAIGDVANVATLIMLKGPPCSVSTRHIIFQRIYYLHPTTMYFHDFYFDMLLVVIGNGLNAPN
jgi:hypothetical protein